jgi:hypothetical protein
MQTMYNSEQFTSNLAHFINLFCVWILGLAYPECVSGGGSSSSSSSTANADGKSNSKETSGAGSKDKAAAGSSGRPIDAFKDITIPPKEVSDTWRVLPACLLEDFVEILEYFEKVVPPGGKLHDFYTKIDVDAVRIGRLS